MSCLQSSPLLVHHSHQTPCRHSRLKPHRRHADRWEQARKAGGDGDKSTIGRGKLAAGMPTASTAAVEAAARESVSVARGAASAQAAAEAVLVGAPPRLPGGGGFRDTAGGRAGSRGGEGGEAVPCRLEGRVEDWNPPPIADLRSSYRWADEQKVTKSLLQAGVSTSLSFYFSTAVDADLFWAGNRRFVRDCSRGLPRVVMMTPWAVQGYVTFSASFEHTQHLCSPRFSPSRCSLSFVFAAYCRIPYPAASFRRCRACVSTEQASMDRIRRFRQGGTALRDLIHAEVIRLDILRHDLFC